jgi:hypothetical protein
MGSPKSWRAAETVEDSGFHCAMSPSHAGMADTAVKGFPGIPGLAVMRASQTGSPAR